MFSLPEYLLNGWIKELRYGYHFESFRNLCYYDEDEEMTYYSPLGLALSILGVDDCEMEDYEFISDELLDELDMDIPQPLIGLEEFSLPWLLIYLNRGITNHNPRREYILRTYKFRKNYGKKQLLRLTFKEFADFLEDNVNTTPRAV